MRSYIFILMLLVLTGCANNFSRVPFKYTNLAHMNYRDAMTYVSRMPEDLVFDLSEAFRNNGANVVERTKLRFFLSENSDAQKCWEADYEIFQQEFAAYHANSVEMFNSIDRDKPFVSRQVKNDCSLFTNTDDPDADSWFLLVELPPRNSQTTVYRPTIDNFFIFDQNKSIHGFSTSYSSEQVAVSVSTRIYIWAWRPAGSQKTLLYLLAKPISGQVEAKAGNSIGFTWWQMANGYAEQQTVKNYIALIKEYDRKESVK